MPHHPPHHPHHPPPPPPPHHRPPHHHGGWISDEEIQELAARLSPYVGDAEYWAELILSDPGPGKLAPLLILPVLEKLDAVLEKLDATRE